MPGSSIRTPSRIWRRIRPSSCRTSTPRRRRSSMPRSAGGVACVGSARTCSQSSRCLRPARAVTAAAITSLPTGDTGFTAGSTVKAVAALADPISGLSTQQTATVNVTNASAFDVQFTIGASAPSGRYNLYVSQPGGAVPLYAGIVSFTTGTAATFNVAMTSGGVSIQANPSGAPATADAPASGNVHTGYIFGKSAFAVPAIG